jgi:hypothetical protein
MMQRKKRLVSDIPVPDVDNVVLGLSGEEVSDAEQHESDDDDKHATGRLSLLFVDRPGIKKNNLKSFK